MLEVTWWAHRSLWHLIFAGVLERHPELQFVFTEQGTAWIPETLGTLDFFFARMGSATGSQELEWGESVVSQLSMRPSEYWARQCHVGIELHAPGRGGHAPRGRRGQDHVGQRLPPQGGRATRSASRPSGSRSPASIPSRSKQMLGGNAARLFGFDLDAPRSRWPHGWAPPTTRSSRPLRAAEIPDEAGRCPAFAGS